MQLFSVKIANRDLDRRECDSFKSEIMKVIVIRKYYDKFHPNKILLIPGLYETQHSSAFSRVKLSSQIPFVVLIFALSLEELVNWLSSE